MLWFMLAAAAPPIFPCATGDLLRSAPPLRRSFPASATGGLATRDPFGVPNQRTSEHFVLRWGSGVSDGTAQDLLDSLELAWEVQVDDLGHVPPPSTGTYLFNVYVGDTGDGAPSSFGAGGYYTVDSEGYPYIVVAEDSTQAYGGLYGHHAAIHELYHALQGATERFPYFGLSAWYFEATAEWSTYETDPGDPFNGSFAWAYLLQPQYPAQFFDYPDSGATTEYRQYGAFLLPRAISLRHGFEIVRDTWIEPGSSPDPMEVLRERLAEEGVDLDELWLDHLAANATFDYPDGDVLEGQVLAYEGYFGGDRVTREVEGAGGDGRVSGAAAPYRYGWASVRLSEPDEGTLLAEVVGDERGSEGSRATWGARVAVEHADGLVDVYPVAFDEDVGSVEVPGVKPRDEVWLLVGPWTDDTDAWDVEQFGFDWSLTVSPPPEPPTLADLPELPQASELPRGCGCAGAGGAPGVAAFVIVLALWRRRDA